MGEGGWCTLLDAMRTGRGQLMHLNCHCMIVHNIRVGSTEALQESRLSVSLTMLLQTSSEISNMVVQACPAETNEMVRTKTTAKGNLLLQQHNATIGWKSEFVVNAREVVDTL